MLSHDSAAQPNGANGVTRISKVQWLIVLAHVVLALTYGVVIPPYEAHDETGHSAFIDHLVTAHSLPVIQKSSPVFLDQSHQPPLYYLSVAALTFWIDRNDHFMPQRNVFAFDGSNRRGARIILPTTNTSGTVLALHAARLVSALMGGFTLFLIALSASTVFASQRIVAQLATAIAAFNPQAIFMGAMVNNDALIALLGAALVYLSVRALRTYDLRTWIWLGVLLGFAVLTKRSAYGLLLFGGLLLLWIGWQARWSWQRWLTNGALTFGLAALIGAPYFVRNLTLYGRIIADRSENNPFSVAPSLATTAEGVWVAWRDGWLPRLLVNGHQTFWGTFGWGNVRMAEWVYWALAVFVGLGVVGIGVALVQSVRSFQKSKVLPTDSHPTTLSLRRNKGGSSPTLSDVLTLMVFCLCTVALPLAQALFFQNPDLFVGRYLMPALGPVALLLALGWRTLCSRLAHRAHRFFHLALSGALALNAIAVPIFTLGPAYYTPITHNINNNNNAALLTFDDVVQVTQVSGSSYIANDPDGQRPYARVTLDWQVLRPITQQLAFGISVLGRNNDVLGQVNVFPAKGNHPSPLWRAGDHWQDSYDVQLMKPCAQLPTMARVSVAVFPFDENLTRSGQTFTPQNLRALDGEGRATTPVIGRFRVDPWPLHYIFWQKPMAKMGHIALRDVQPGLPITTSADSTVTLQLTYETAQSSNQDGRTFVHVLDAQGQLVTQDDHAPAAGTFPTDLWQAGWCDTESFHLHLPITATGRLRVVTGFYTAEGVRFRTVPTHTDNLVELGEIRVNH